jgi:hypothetical protein
MPTVVDLSEQELAELRTCTKQSDDAAALRIAMTEYLRYVRRMELKAISGRVQMEENWQALEESERRDREG